ncbi:MAG: helix-turn-helix domain-containing protein [Mycobacterium sp.]|nr:helix-turn-helix domain-containing protein [Mycobacterium sp.]
MTAATDHTVLPHAGDVQLKAIVAILKQATPLTVTDGARSLALSDDLRDVMLHAAAALLDGQAVTVQPVRVVLTTQEAADVLGVSRPTLVKLLESGQIPFVKPGRHRRVQLADVLDYQGRIRTQRRDRLDAMTADAAVDDAYRSAAGFTETR